MSLAKETIQIQGMSCAACVRRVEKGLSTLEGVNSASVNFATERASVEYDSEAVTPSALKAKIKELGYDVVETQVGQDEKLQKTTVSIGGMTCAACVRRVGMNR
jgi:Cu+-exporting ATPase